MAKPPKRLKDSEQIKAFKEAARAHECDESEEPFDKALGKIGKAAPKAAPIKRAIKTNR
ncbi:MAG: hypothetical protein KGJ78_17465 [Alphaproteobacteria bacterium]|nr:hypothetical protein [Alphaproteobacteria bacterium]